MQVKDQRQALGPAGRFPAVMISGQQVSVRPRSVAAHSPRLQDPSSPRSKGARCRPQVAGVPQTADPIHLGHQEHLRLAREGAALPTTLSEAASSDSRLRSQRGEAQGAEEGRLPTWGLTRAARQRRLNPGTIKRVLRSVAEQQRLPLLCRRPAPGARRRATQRLSPTSCALAKTHAVLGPRLVQLLWAHAKPRVSSRPCLGCGSRRADRSPGSALRIGGRLHAAPTPFTPPSPPGSSVCCAPAPPGRATLEVPRCSRRRQSARVQPSPPGGKRENRKTLRGPKETELGPRSTRQQPSATSWVDILVCSKNTCKVTPAIGGGVPRWKCSRAWTDFYF
ncbi:uncharacterized protein LOC103744600 [Nannospalax galili]|uniref:uncharacterized protein LOC103744600 n=1 Tax=Nannospalax galili TaxID=1026970 RepID=UPI0004ED1461|nr:uncharacterized protein LOC103744600 [Nannospalax galili]